MGEAEYILHMKIILDMDYVASKAYNADFK